MQELVDEQVKSGARERRDIFTQLVQTIGETSTEATLRDVFGSEYCPDHLLLSLLSRYHMLIALTSDTFIFLVAGHEVSRLHPTP